MSDTQHRYAVILAGGFGRRLWPLSTSKSPKQFRGLDGAKPMILQTWERLADCIPADHIFVSTTMAHVEEVRAAMPALNPSRLIVEPSAAGKPAAFLLIAHKIHELDPDAVVFSSASDSYVTPLTAFQDDCDRAYTFVEGHDDWLVLFGNRPHRPDMTLGYVRGSGAALDAADVLVAREFREKPTYEEAERFVADEEFFWNSSHYFFSARTLIDAYRRADAGWAAGVESYAERGNIADYPSSGGPSHELTPFTEGGVPLGVLPADFRWHDMGTWPSSYRALVDTRPTDLVTVGPSLVDIDSRTSIVVNESPMTVITAGLDGMAVVVTDAVVFVAPIKDLENDSDLLSRLRQEHEALHHPHDLPQNEAE